MSIEVVLQCTTADMLKYVYKILFIVEHFDALWTQKHRPTDIHTI